MLQHPKKSYIIVQQIVEGPHVGVMVRCPQTFSLVEYMQKEKHISVHERLYVVKILPKGFSDFTEGCRLETVSLIKYD